MKVEIINPSTGGVVETYVVPNFLMRDFQEWISEQEVVLDFKCLLNTVKNLDSEDPETGKPASNLREVDFYLPEPIKNRMLYELAKRAKSQMDIVESPDQILDEVTDRVSTLELQSSTILLAVVQEILQNHPDSGYKVRISDE